jgi:hypothetical protein
VLGYGTLRTDGVAREHQVILNSSLDVGEGQVYTFRSTLRLEFELPVRRPIVYGSGRCRERDRSVSIQKIKTGQ